METILFLPGSNTTASCYKRLIKLLSLKFNVFVLDYPGFSGNLVISGKHTDYKYLKHIDNFITQNKLTNIHLLGASLGGYLAVKFVAFKKHPSVKSVILFSPLTKMRTTSLWLNLFTYLLNRAQTSLSIRRPLIGCPLRSLFSISPSERLRHTKYALTRKLETWDIPKVPTLVVFGRYDVFVDSDYTLRLFTGKDKVKVVNITKGGHNASLQIGEKILEEIIDFTQTSQ